MAQRSASYQSMLQIYESENRKAFGRRVMTAWVVPPFFWAIRTPLGWMSLKIRRLPLPKGLMGATVVREGDPATITISKEAARLPNLAKGVLIHELAHAISGETSHGAKWRATAQRLRKDLGEDVPFTAKSIKIAYEGRQ